MAAELRHTLLNLEVTPPTVAWDVIASRLGTEFDAEEIQLAQKIDVFEIAPPADAWENIAGSIADDPEEVEATPVIKMRKPFRRWAAAAAAIVVLSLGGWYILDNYSVPDAQATLVPEAKANETPGAPEQQQQPAPKDELVNTEPDRPQPRRKAPIVAAAKAMDVSAASYTNNLPEVKPYIPAGDLPHAGLQHIHSVSTTESPSVEAPPIRDASGNIILDKDLIFAPDNNYIIVTGPNGEQTRISSKFLPLLSSLNANTEGLDYFHFFLNENNIWKLRFDQWRDKMLKQASFIPTATNLLDLLELKEILQEN